MRYALIQNSKVANIIELNPKNQSDFPSAVLLLDVPAAIGDTYQDGVYYRNGERVLTNAEILALMEQETPIEEESQA
ncbi:hypothetical protein SDC9_151972 [bioreactor metagenome]|uniref:Uncharacterized protein n=1 Tax=bioreactor metagenome TaxID=1076179 RepID=A0A645ESC5_9ZZZZ